MLPYPPSSPSIAFFKDGVLVSFYRKTSHIEGRSADLIAENLKDCFINHNVTLILP